MRYGEQWIMLTPRQKTCWIIKGAFASLVVPIIFGFPIFISLIEENILLDLIILIYLIIIIVINLIIITWAALFYSRYRYKIGADAVNIKRGILWKRDVTIPYERIQHVSSTRGPIEQLLGLHIVNIFTAGTSSVGAGFGGTSGFFTAEGYIPGITDPESLKETIMSRVKKSRSGSGLGEKIEKAEEKVTRTKSMDAEMVNELKKIRKLLEKGQKTR